MGVADRAAAFLGSMRTAAGPVVQQMGAAAQRAGQSIAQTYQAVGGQVRNQLSNYAPMGSQLLGQVGTSVGAALSGAPTPTTYYGNTNVVASQGGINPGGLLGAIGMQNAASKLQAAYQDPRTAQMLGAGALGAGVLGAGALGLAAVKAGKKSKEERMAGHNLGQQLGVNMPRVMYGIKIPNSNNMIMF